METIPFSPVFVLGTAICIGYAALAHVTTGRSLRDLIIYLVMSTLGFGFGQMIGRVTQSPLLLIGELHLFEASLAAWLLLSVTIVLGRR